MIGRRGLAPAAILVALAGPVRAAKTKTESATGAPAWARDASAATMPGDTSGLDSVLLLDDWLVQPLAEGGVRTTHRFVLKVLRPEGLEDVTSTAVTYGKDDRVERLEAWNLLPDGSLRRPDPKDDVSDLAFAAGAGTVDDVRLRHLSVPGAVVGSVVAFETVEVDGIDRGARIVRFGDEDAPVGACRLAVEVPAGWTAADHAQRADAFTRTEDAGRIAWSAASVARPPQEDFAPDSDELLPAIAVSWRSPDGARGFADWNAVAAWYRRLAEPVLADAGEAKSLSAALKPAGADGLAAALRGAFAYASRDIRYVAIEMGIGGYKPQAPAFTCSNRYGDCKAKSFLMRSVVEPWGVKVFPVLVLTADAGTLLREVPTPGQFNHCIAAVALPDGLVPDAWNVAQVDGVGRVAFMDPTTTTLGPWQLRDDDQGTTALLVLPERGVLVDLPVRPPSAARTEIRLEATLDELGRVSAGSLTSRATGMAAGDARPLHQQLRQDQVKDALQRWLQEFVPGATLGAISVEGIADLDADVVETVTFTGGTLAQRAGEMLVVQPPALALPVPSARLRPAPRATRLELGLPEEIAVEVRMTAPRGWSPESLPGPAAKQAPQFTLECSWERTDDGFAVHGRAAQLARFVEPADYAAFREAARAASASESQGVVLVPGASLQ